MINNSPFDDHIKKEFGNYRPEVPPHIWENIMAQKERRKPVGFLFYLRGNRLVFLLLIFFSISAGALLIHNMYKKDAWKMGEAADGSASVHEQPGTAETINKDENSSLKNISPGSNDVVVPVADGVRHAGSLMVNNTRGSVDLTGSTVNRSNTIKDNGSLSKRAAQNNPKKKEIQFKSQSVADAGKITQVSIQKRNNSKSYAGRANLAIETPGTEPFGKTQETIAGALSTGTDNKNDVGLRNYYLDLNTKAAEKTFSFEVKNINIPALNIPCPGSEKNAAANKRYFEIYGGPDYAFRTFTDTANSSYLQKRKESTHVNSAFSFGMRYTKVFNNGFSLRTGINYSQVNETFKFEQGHMIQIVYIINSNGDTTGSYATTGTRYKTTHNKYRTIDVPLIVGYEMGNGRLRTNINAGLIVNAYSWQKGDLLDSSYQPVNITTGKSSSPYQFKTNVGLGVTAGVSFYYRLAGNLYILAEPYLRYNFSAANKADITLKQKYTTVGVKFGVRIDF